MKKVHLIKESSEVRGLVQRFQTPSINLPGQLNKQVVDGHPLEVFIPVTSSNLTSVFYANKDNYLYVIFHNGKAYRYKGISSREYAGLMGSESVGKYFFQYIKDKYSYKEVDIV